MISQAMVLVKEKIEEIENSLKDYDQTVTLSPEEYGRKQGQIQGLSVALKILEYLQQQNI